MPKKFDDDKGEEKKEEHSIITAPSDAAALDGRPASPNNSAKENLNSKTHSKPTIKTSKTSNSLGRFFVSLLSWSAQSVLFLCFLALAAVYCLRSIHDDYFVPIVTRARRTDDDLLDEFTYYQRECNLADVAAGIEDAQDLFIRPDSKNYGVDQMMTHGAVLFPGLLSSETVRDLRQFIVDKNAAVKGTAAEFPMSQGYQRISYGIEATEDPAVVRALKEIHHNVELQHLLEGLLGENPALTEITAITAGHGCPHQVWHPDVKPDGNGVMFGRTYSHSYSLFMPLQNTTGAMGATDLCPGTHYCAGMDLHELCEEQKIGMHQVSGQGFWPEGSAALLNQQVWHRGAQHTDADAQERVVFIVSFLARPNDTRQLSRGTYFHMKWNMWGHTWKDLKDSMRHMSWPWNILTCLHIWRPESHGWGYDLITSAAMRIGNNQLGCEPEDLQIFLNVLERARFPEWLDGTIDFDDDEAWEIYIRETIANMWSFVVKVNKFAMGGYFGLVLIVAMIRGRRSAIQTLWGGIKGVLVSHVIVTILAVNILLYFRSTSRVQDVMSGRMLMRPFPPVPTTMAGDPTVSTGPTTLPNRQDVLLSGRLDARTIGAYNRWLEFHPGNQEFLKGVSTMGSELLYRSYVKDLPFAFRQAIEDAAMEPILSKGGRFLQQDYRTGDWLYMRPNERDAKVKQTLYVGVEGPLYELRKELDFDIGEARFGFSRETAMTKKLLLFLYDLDSKLFGRFADDAIEPRSGKSNAATTTVLSPTLWKLQPIQPLAESLTTPRDWISRWTVKPLINNEFTVGEELVYKYTLKNSGRTRTTSATLVQIHGNGGLFDIAFYGKDVRRHGVVRTVPRTAVEKAPTLSEGSLVWADYREGGDWFPGKIRLIGPDGFADIDYADGDYEADLSRDRYRPRFE